MAVIIQHQDEIEVFANEAGNISITQNDPSDRENHIIYIQPRDIPRLIRALRDAAASIREARG